MSIRTLAALFSSSIVLAACAVNTAGEENEPASPEGDFGEEIPADQLAAQGCTTREVWEPRTTPLCGIPARGGGVSGTGRSLHSCIETVCNGRVSARRCRPVLDRQGCPACHSGVICLIAGRCQDARDCGVRP
jgi:hypothetical protein